MSVDTDASSVRVLFPVGATLERFLVAESSVSRPFATERLEALEALSRAILRHPTLRSDAAAVALAFWIRKAHMAAMASSFVERRGEGVLLVPAGRVFHIAPANVDTLFAYSWALAFVAGNRSIVRLSQRTTSVVAALLDALAAAAVECPTISADNLFVTYPHDAGMSARLSAWCDQRMVWGGNETVETLRGASLSPHAGERSFASKLSHAAIGVEGYLAADEMERDRLAERFCNDLFVFGQQACSSPQWLFWVGEDNAAAAARDDWTARMEAVIVRRGWSVDGPTANERRLQAFDLAMRCDLAVDLSRPAFVQAYADEAASLDKSACSGGLVRHATVASLDEIVPLLDAGDQTLAHACLPDAALESFARKAGARGLDRVVPIGEALAFEPTWDGWDLLADMTRRVTLRRR